MTHKRPQRQKFTHFEAVKEIVKTKKTAFQRELLKAFAHALPGTGKGNNPSRLRHYNGG